MQHIAQDCEKKRLLTQTFMLKSFTSNDKLLMMISYHMILFLSIAKLFIGLRSKSS